MATANSIVTNHPAIARKPEQRARARLSKERETITYDAAIQQYRLFDALLRLAIAAPKERKQDDVFRTSCLLKTLAARGRDLASVQISALDDDAAVPAELRRTVDHDE